MPGEIKSVNRVIPTLSPDTIYFEQTTEKYFYKIRVFVKYAYLEVALA